MALLGLHLALSSLIGLFAEWFGIDKKTKQLLSGAVLVFVVVVSLAAVAMSVMDVLKLVWYEFFDRDIGDGGEQDRQQVEEDTRPNSC